MDGVDLVKRQLDQACRDITSDFWASYLAWLDEQERLFVEAAALGWFCGITAWVPDE